ncbi:DUF1566 domain-containing protein, partial [Lamprobacter modestohalophilus]|uniref:DUF1566 domain-containing protein n=1 Tax=Lamprobacter modestohalophilus TaxID=1064514 RepID=UPI002ADEE77A
MMQLPRAPQSIVSILVVPLCVASLALTGQANAQPPHPLNDTGIDWCANGDTILLDCPVAGYPGQDGEYGRDVTRNDDSDGHAGFSFTKLDAEGQPLPADATEWSCVRDNVTGAVWEVKTNDLGLRGTTWLYSWYDSESPDGVPGTEDGGACFTDGRCDTEKYVADVNAQGLCGYTDWRMPTPKELAGITYLGINNTAIDSDYFPNTDRSDGYWSSSPKANSSRSAWLVSLLTGNVESGFKSSDIKVRLVRAGQPTVSFVDNGDGTITDENTGLMWAKCSVGRGGPDCGSDSEQMMGWQQALTYAEEATLAGYSDWRLPNVKELQSLVDYGTVEPAIDERLFPATPSSLFWSSSPDAWPSSYAWSVDFSGGDFYGHPKGYDLAIRLVRRPLSLTVTLTGNGQGTVTSTPAGIDCGTDCSEVYQAGTEVTLTATPAAGSEFGGWSEPSCGTATTCTFTVYGGKTITATFSATPGIGLYNPAR